ncbi:MAG: hypothetical protein QXH80_00480 [Candidatus Nanoarchaeia archaeon]
MKNYKLFANILILSFTLGIAQFLFIANAYDIGIPETDQISSIALLAANIEMKAIIFCMDGTRCANCEKFIFDRNLTKQENIKLYGKINKSILLIPDLYRDLLLAIPTENQEIIFKLLDDKVIQDKKELHLENSKILFRLPPKKKKRLIGKNTKLIDLLYEEFQLNPDKNVCIVRLNEKTEILFAYTIRVEPLGIISPKELGMENIIKRCPISNSSESSDTLFIPDRFYILKYCATFYTKDFIDILEKSDFWSKHCFFEGDFIAENVIQALSANGDEVSIDYLFKIFPKIKPEHYSYYLDFLPSPQDMGGKYAQRLSEMRAANKLFDFAYNTKYWEPEKAIWKGDNRPDDYDCWTDFKIPEKILIKTEKLNEDAILSYYKYAKPFVISGLPLKRIEDIDISTPEKAYISALSAKTDKWQNKTWHIETGFPAFDSFKSIAYGRWYLWNAYPDDHSHLVRFRVDLKLNDDYYVFLHDKIRVPQIYAEFYKIKPESVVMNIQKRIGSDYKYLPVKTRELDKIEDYIKVELEKFDEQ